MPDALASVPFLRFNNTRSIGPVIAEPLVLVIVSACVNWRDVRLYTIPPDLTGRSPVTLVGVAWVIVTGDENSDVLPLGSVAVDVMSTPAGMLSVRMKLKDAAPLLLVSTLRNSRLAAP